ncbi:MULTISPECIES: hypothetical protein [Lactobacillus]|nr:MULTISPECIES: hypothetical protein [Lactobacillus]
MQKRLQQLMKEIKRLQYLPISPWFKPEVLRDDVALAMIQTVN